VDPSAGLTAAQKEKYIVLVGNRTPVIQLLFLLTSTELFRFSLLKIQ
jgi:hypothetical protein